MASTTKPTKSKVSRAAAGPSKSQEDDWNFDRPKFDKTSRNRNTRRFWAVHVKGPMVRYSWTQHSSRFGSSWIFSLTNEHINSAPLFNFTQTNTNIAMRCATENTDNLTLHWVARKGVQDLQTREVSRIFVLVSAEWKCHWCCDQGRTGFWKTRRFSLSKQCIFARLVEPFIGHRTLN